MPRILLVEDNLMNRDMLSRRLERRGFEVLHAENGAEGVELARSENPDLVVMDMSLPVMDGYQATRLIKSEQAVGKGIPVLGLSAHAMSGDAERAIDAGCDDYDTKPIDFKRLLEKIDALLARNAPPATTIVPLPVPEPAARAAHALVLCGQALLRDVLVHRLARLDISADVAETFEQALALLAATPTDGVLLAAELGLHRPDAVAAVRRAAGDADLPVVLIVDEEPYDLILGLLRAGAADFVPKPFYPELLRARLLGAVERRRLVRQLEPRA